MKAVVIFHKNCIDGWCAAWAAHKSLGDDDVEYLAASYGESPPYDKISGKRVFILDFSWPRSDLITMTGYAASLRVLDHHESAQEELRDLKFCEFDMQRSGAAMAWEYFHGRKSAPWIIEYAQDRDLWRHELPYTKEIAAAMQSWPKDFAYWNTRSDNEGRDLAISEGTAILRYQAQVLESHLKAVRFFTVNAQRTPIINLHGQFASDTLDALREKYQAPLAISWYQQWDGKYLYSARGEGAKELAVSMGGGGHALAAGFACASHPQQLFNLWEDK